MKNYVIGYRSFVSNVNLMGNNIDVVVGDHTILGSDAKIYGDGSVRIGDYSSIASGTAVNLGKNGHLTLGHNVKIGANCYIDASGGVEISNNVTIGHGCKIFSSFRGPDQLNGGGYNWSENVQIDEDAWFMGNCTIVAPLRAKARSTARHGAVISNELMEENQVYEGNPAINVTEKRLSAYYKTFTSEEKVAILRDLIEQFRREKKIKGSELQACIKLPEDPDPNVSYFSVSDRTYTKRNRAQEIDFMSWLLSSNRAKFTPA